MNFWIAMLFTLFGAVAMAVSCYQTMWVKGNRNAQLWACAMVFFLLWTVVSGIVGFEAR